jgi:hypothetical protein
MFYSSQQQLAEKSNILMLNLSINSFPMKGMGKKLKDGN